MCFPGQLLSQLSTETTVLSLGNRLWATMVWPLEEHGHHDRFQTYKLSTNPSIGGSFVFPFNPKWLGSSRCRSIIGGRCWRTTVSTASIWTLATVQPFASRSIWLTMTWSSLLMHWGCPILLSCLELIWLPAVVSGLGMQLSQSLWKVRKQQRKKNKEE